MARNGSDDDAPWLAEADNDIAAGTMVPRRRVFGGIILFVLLVVLVVTGVYVISAKKQDGASGTPVARAEDAPLIKADPGPYKTAPSDPGGKQVDGAGGVIYDAGNDIPGSNIDASRAPEELDVPSASQPTSILPENDSGLPAIPPAAGTMAAAKPAVVATRPAVVTVAPTMATPPVAKTPPVAAAPVVAPAAAKLAPPKPVEAKAAPVKVAEPKSTAPKVAEPPKVAEAKSGSATLQLGALGSPAKAEAEWATLTGKFGFLGSLSHRVEPVAHGDTTLYRLRAGAADHAAAVALCDRVKAGGAPCTVVQ